jgi:hypothetical protein
VTEPRSVELRPEPVSLSSFIPHRVSPPAGLRQRSAVVRLSDLPRGRPSCAPPLPGVLPGTAPTRSLRCAGRPDRCRQGAQVPYLGARTDIPGTVESVRSGKTEVSKRSALAP